MDLHAASRLPFDPAAFRSLFCAPGAGYRSAPFWAWNGILDREVLLEQIDQFLVMGFGGAHAHARTGLRTPYMGETFMELVRVCADHLEARGGLLWLYDEDRWPSGYAGGAVTRDAPELCQRVLRFTRRPDPAGGPVLARYAVRLDRGRLQASRRLEESAALLPGEQAWTAVLETAAPRDWFNGQCYPDILNPEAMARFIALTHERYAEVLGDRLGRSVPAIFTDEPGGGRIDPAASGEDPGDLTFPWTPDLPDTYRERFACDLLDSLPEVVWDLADGSVSPARWRYHDHRSERFATVFAGSLGSWCDGHGIALTGHFWWEDSPTNQVQSTGDLMRCYQHFAIPGIDLLVDQHLPWVVKQAASVARQMGRSGVMSELYGVTGWHFDFTGHKRQGDWQAALGVTLRVPHHAWMTMAGDAKRDYPGAIDAHVPWWREYRVVEDHFARVCTALTRGRPLVRVAVVHPLETTWLHFGPADGSGRRLAWLDEAFRTLTRTLVGGLIDFDFVGESILPRLHRPVVGPVFAVGEMGYDVVLLPWMATIRPSTLAALRAFAARGGRIVILGAPPALVAGAPDASATAWLAACETLPADLHDWDRHVHEPAAEPQRDCWGWMKPLLTALEAVRELRATRADGQPATSLSSQLRVDGDARWLFCCCSDDEGPGQGVLTLAVRGAWSVQRCDTQDGGIAAVACQVVDGWTRWSWTCHPAGHELVRLEPCASPAALPAPPATEAWQRIAVLAAPARYRLDEPNVLVLDRAAWRLHRQAVWQPETPLMRIGRGIDTLYNLRHVPSPWSQPPAPLTDRVDLRFHFHSDVPVEGVRLALELADQAGISLDGQPITAQADGWWVDRAIATVPLPPLAAGRHELAITLPVQGHAVIESCYLLGAFGVWIEPDGCTARLTGPLAELAPADVVHQGLPFYTGNLTLTWEVEVPADGAYSLDLGRPSGALATVAVDGTRRGHGAFPPYRVALGRLAAGRHTIEVTAFGTRANAFGPLHCAEPGRPWQGPEAYEETGAAWSDAWRLRPAGLRRPPVLLKAGD